MLTDGSRRTVRPALKAALAAVLAAATLSGCAQAVAGTPTANEAAAATVRQEQQKVRDCESARVDLTRSFTDALEKAESDFVGAASDLTTVMKSAAPRDFGRRCGPQLVGPAYSQLLVDLQKVQLTSPSATILRSSLLRGMCPTDGKIELTPEAERACSAAR
jgi:hypothetical protein